MESESFIYSLFQDVTISSFSIGVIVSFVIAFFLLFVSGIVSASEVAFFSLTPKDINSIQESGSKKDKILQYLLSRSEFLLASILITNNFVNVLIVMLCTYGFNEWLDFTQSPFLGFILQTIILTFLLLLFGEIMPKVYAQKNALKWVRLLARTLQLMERFCRPLSIVLIKSTKIFNKSLSLKNNELTVDELSKALELTSTELPEEKEMLAEIIKFYKKTASEIMTPRLDMEDIDIKISFGDVIKFIVDSGFSRIPVYEKTEDDIRGILYIKDLLPYIGKPSSFHWQSLIRPACFVPETKKIDDLLEDFRTNKIHMAIVVDEFGATQGLVTMEDILEEIVGEISDEYDVDERLYIRTIDGAFLFEAKILLNDFYKVINVEPDEFGKLTDEVETLAGLLLEIKGEFPQKDEIIKIKNYEFKIIAVDNRRIRKVKVKRIEDEIELSENK